MSHNKVIIKDFFVFLILFYFLTNALKPSFGDNYPQQPGVDILHYFIEIRFNGNSNEVKGHTDLTFKLKGLATSKIHLDFSALIVDSILIAGVKTTFLQKDDKILIPLKKSNLTKGKSQISVFYHGTPQDGLYLGPNKFDEWVVFADNWPNRAHYWFPCIDHPSDKASVKFKMTCPDSFETIANGVLIQESKNSMGTKTAIWLESKPIPTYCMVFGAAKFSVVKADTLSNTPLFYYLFPKDKEHGISDFRRAGKVSEFFSELIAPFPYQKLALVQSTTRFGGMENSSAIFFPEQAITGKNLLIGTVAHEIAHQWFGDSVTESDWHHLWLSEGFATYFGTLFFEHADGKEEFRRRMSNQKRRILKYQEQAGLRPIVDTTITNLFDLLNPNNYSKGSWVLHMLRGLLGDENFFAAIREFYKQFKEKNALTQDFQQVLEEFYGEPLDWFFNQWVYGSGYPEYAASWTWKTRQQQIEISISQNQTGQLFKIPLEIQFEYSDSSRSKTFWLDKRKEVFTVSSREKPQQIFFDPNEWVLKTLVVANKEN